MIKTNCNCGEKVACGCGTLSFDTYENNTFGVLTVGNLVASGCTLDEYVIDWYVDDVKMLTSGVGYDPEITTYHPFLGTASVPVINGVWVPVVRYIVVEGTQIFLSPKSCHKWCEIVVDLPQITVESIGCWTTGGSPSYYYTFAMSYNATQDFANAARSFKYYLNTDGSTKYVAIYFVANTVTDMIEVYHNGTLKMISLVVGTLNNTSNNFSEPYQRSTTTTKFVLVMPDYTAGDFLLIKITPSIKSPGVYNTDWKLNLVCQNADIPYAEESSFWNYNDFDYDLDNVRMVWNPSTCRWEARVKLTTTLYASTMFTNLGRFAPINQTTYGFGSFDTTTNEAMLTHEFTLGLSNYYVYTGTTLFGYIDTISDPNVGLINVSKSGSIVTITCTTQYDYDDFKNKYQWLMINDPFATDYNADNSTLEHFRFINMPLRNSLLGCGDQYTSRNITFHITSPVTFDDSNKIIQITLTNTTVDNYPDDPPCTSRKSTLVSMVSAVNSSINIADFSDDTICRPMVPFHGRRWVLTSASRLDVNGGRMFAADGHWVLPYPIQGFCYGTDNLHLFKFVVFYMRSIITDDPNSPTFDPANNFELYRYYRRSGESCIDFTATPTLMYKKLNGVVVFREDQP